MPQFMCRATRQLMNDSEESAIDIENALIGRSAGAPRVNLRDHEQAWMFMTQRYLSSDYTLKDAFVVANLTASCSYETLKSVVTRCILQGKSSIAYLQTALENEAKEESGKATNDARIQAIYDDAVRDSKRLLTPLPPLRFPGAFASIADQAKIDDRYSEILTKKARYGETFVGCRAVGGRS